MKGNDPTVQGKTNTQT